MGKTEESSSCSWQNAGRQEGPARVPAEGGPGRGLDPREGELRIVPPQCYYMYLTLIFCV